MISSNVIIESVVVFGSDWFRSTVMIVNRTIVIQSAVVNRQYGLVGTIVISSTVMIQGTVVAVVVGCVFSIFVRCVNASIRWVYFDCS